MHLAVAAGLLDFFVNPTPASPPDPAKLAERIDAHLDARLKAEKATPAPQVDDAEFLRRACLGCCRLELPTGEC